MSTVALSRFACTAALLAFCCPATQAKTTCVSDVSQIAPALLDAQDNGEDDTIYIEVGNFLLTSESSYFAANDETYKLSIIGGMAPGCNSGTASSGNTVLDGQDMTRIFTISAQGEINIGRITFAHGGPSMYFGGAINVANGSDADTTIFNNVFVSNKTSSGNGGGAVYVQSSTQGDIFVWSNFFLVNSSSGGGAIYANGNHTTYVTGNTIIANELINHTGLAGGLYIAGTGVYWTSNNVLWNNDVQDVYDQDGKTHYSNNDIGTIAGVAPFSTANELSVDPDFDGLSFKPKPGSPLVNAGNDAPSGGVGGCCDAGGGPRTIGRHVDIGAYETDVLFRDGFGT